MFSFFFLIFTRLPINFSIFLPSFEFWNSFKFTELTLIFWFSQYFSTPSDLVLRNLVFLNHLIFFFIFTVFYLFLRFHIFFPSFWFFFRQTNGWRKERELYENFSHKWKLTKKESSHKISFVRPTFQQERTNNEAISIFVCVCVCLCSFFLNNNKKKMKGYTHMTTLNKTPMTVSICTCCYPFNLFFCVLQAQIWWHLRRVCRFGW